MMKKMLEQKLEQLNILLKLLQSPESNDFKIEVIKKQIQFYSRSLMDIQLEENLARQDFKDEEQLSDYYEESIED